MRQWIIVGASALAVAACERPAQPSVEADPVESGTPVAGGALSGFSHEISQDVSGYYMPVTPAQVGTWRLRNVSILLQSDMEA